VNEFASGRNPDVREEPIDELSLHSHECCDVARPYVVGDRDDLADAGPRSLSNERQRFLVESPHTVDQCIANRAQLIERLAEVIWDRSITERPKEDSLELLLPSSQRRHVALCRRGPREDRPLLLVHHLPDHVRQLVRKLGCSAVDCKQL